MNKFTKSISINSTIDNPSWKIDLLDLVFDILNHKFYPYRKDKNKINSISSKSNYSAYC